MAGCFALLDQAVPKKVHHELWVDGLRDAIKGSCGRGWTVQEKNGQVRLNVRREGFQGSVVLPFPWERSATGDIQARIRNIFSLVHQGRSLKEAALVAARAAPQAGGCAWQEALIGFEKEKRMEGLREKGWSDNYQPFLAYVVDLFEGRNPPATAMELGRLLVERWEPHPRSRQIAVNTLLSFLNYCIEVYGINAGAWTLTSRQKKILKGPPSKKRNKAVLTDDQMLSLLDSLGNRPEAQLWRKRLMLAMLYGLRPEELNHLEPKLGPDGTPLVWCAYEKPSGTTRTKPRWLDPCPLKGADWNDLDLDIGVIAKDSLGQFLSRQPLWNKYKRVCVEKGEWLRPYVFRDSYALRCHVSKRPLNRICLAMGHSPLVHQQHYRWADDSIVLKAQLESDWDES